MIHFQVTIILSFVALFKASLEFMCNIIGNLYFLLSIPAALRTTGHKHFVIAPISSIVGKDGSEFVNAEWTDELKMKAVEVSVKGSTIKLYPAIKIEQQMKTVRILPALNTVEEQYKKMVAKGRDVELCHETVLGRYPSRLAVNENFKELVDTGFMPEFR